mgnify:CR=1 FL=1
MQNSDVLTSLWAAPHSLWSTPPHLHHFATTWATFWELLWGLCWPLVGQPPTFLLLGFSAAGGARPAFRPPNYCFVYWFLWVPAGALPACRRHRGVPTPHPHVSCGVAYKRRDWPALEAHHARGSTPPNLQVTVCSLHFAECSLQFAMADPAPRGCAHDCEDGKYQFVVSLPFHSISDNFIWRSRICNSVWSIGGPSKVHNQELHSLNHYFTDEPEILRRLQFHNSRPHEFAVLDLENFDSRKS